jgi:hypothetical protein
MTCCSSSYTHSTQSYGQISAPVYIIRVLNCFACVLFVSSVKYLKLKCAVTITEICLITC